MKKLLLLWTLFCLVACSTPTEEPFVAVYDDANILSPQVKDVIKAADYGNVSIVVATCDSLPLHNLNAYRQEQFDKISESLGADYKCYGVLVLASNNPNIAVAKFGSQIEEWNHGAPDYGSNAYFSLQVDDEPIDQKTLKTIEKAVNFRLLENNIIAYLRGELFGNLYTGLIKPDDSFLYRYVIFPCQWPFVQMLKLTKSFYISILLVLILLFVVFRLLVRYIVCSKHNYLSLKPNQQSLNESKVQSVSGCLEILVCNIPIFVGGLSFAISFGITGIEHIGPLIEQMHLPLNLVAKLYESSLSQSSMLMSIVVIAMMWINDYDAELFNIKTTIKMGALSVVLFLSPISVLWVLFVYNIIPIVAMRSYKAFWSDTYMESRVHGLGKIESFFFGYITACCNKFRSMGWILFWINSTNI